MAVFISYTQPDVDVVRILRTDLERVNRSVWLDHQISGGQDWWQEIIQQIQSAEVFLFALSNDSWQSRPCRIELDYAEQLKIPVVPVQVGPLDNSMIKIAQRQIIDYRTRSPDAVIELIRVVTDLLTQPRRLPDPLPPPPEMPFEYLYRLEGRIRNVHTIPPEDQERAIAELRHKLKTEDDADVRTRILMLLEALRRREDVLTVHNAGEIDEILSQATKQPSASPAPDDRRPLANTPPREPPTGPWWVSAEPRVVPEWLKQLINTEGGKAGVATTVADGARPSAQSSDPPSGTRKWWDEQPSPKSPDAPAAAHAPAVPATPLPSSPPATGTRQRIVWALAIAGLLIAIIVVAVLSGG